jgi:catechol 2,3-dioxygenase-like lactoylglutathione lyase family enzyme
MSIQARYVHTNLIARDWRSLARFYQDVFGCVPVPPERDYFGDDLDRGTGVRGARLAGMHLRLPGVGADGPTLEVFQYSPPGASLEPSIHRPGFAHIAFSVPDVKAARAEVLAKGGSAVGEVVTLSLPTGEEVEWCYVADPEGNGIELQTWL